MEAFSAIWSKLDDSNPLLQRSGHCTAIIGTQLFIYGGEYSPDVSQNGDLHILRRGPQPDAETSTNADARDSAVFVDTPQTSPVFRDPNDSTEESAAPAHVSIDSKGAPWYGPSTPGSHLVSSTTASLRRPLGVFHFQSAMVPTLQALAVHRLLDNSDVVPLRHDMRICNRHALSVFRRWLVVLPYPFTGMDTTQPTSKPAALRCISCLFR